LNQVTFADVAASVLRIVAFFALPGAYVVAAWGTYRRWRMLGLAALWICSSLLFGYVSFRVVCARPLTCDVGDPFSAHYLRYVGGFFTFVGATGFGLASALVLVRSRHSAGRFPRPSDIAFGALAGVAGWVVGMLVLQAFHV